MYEPKPCICPTCGKEMMFLGFLMSMEYFEDQHTVVFRSIPADVVAAVRAGQEPRADPAAGPARVLVQDAGSGTVQELPPAAIASPAPAAAAAAGPVRPAGPVQDAEKKEPCDYCLSVVSSVELDKVEKLCGIRCCLKCSRKPETVARWKARFK